MFQDGELKRYVSYYDEHHWQNSSCIGYIESICTCGALRTTFGMTMFDQCVQQINNI